MLKIGITGGIGSGKSTISEVFRAMGFPVFNSDEEAKRILYQSADLHQKLRAVFGEGIFVNGIPDRKALSEMVFSSKEKLEKLNQLIHPMVRKSFEDWILKQESEFIFKEAAILVESGSYKDCDRIIVVQAPEEIRITRVMKRDSVSEESVRKRMQNQMKAEELSEYSDFIIDNDGNHAVLPQIKRILEQLRKS